MPNEVFGLHGQLPSNGMRSILFDQSCLARVYSTGASLLESSLNACR